MSVFFLLRMGGEGVAPTGVDGSHHKAYDISDPRHPYWQRRIEVEDEPAVVPAVVPPVRPTPEVAAESFMVALKRAVGADAEFVELSAMETGAPDDTIETDLRAARQSAHQARERAMLEAVLLAELID